MFVVTVISALSMAGMPFLMGFVAKEVLLDAMLHYEGRWASLVMLVVLFSTAFTAMAAYMLIYDVFLKRAQHEIHFHQPPALIRLSPLILSVLSLSLGFLLEPVIIPLLEPAVPKSFELYLFAGFNEVFLLEPGRAARRPGALFGAQALIARIGFPLLLRRDL